MKIVCCSIAIVIALAISGCGNGVDAAPDLKKADTETVKQMQPGANGSKAAHGGGAADMDIVPAKPGEKTGVPESGAKAGGN